MSCIRMDSYDRAQEEVGGCHHSLHVTSSHPSFSKSPFSKALGQLEQETEILTRVTKSRKISQNKFLSKAFKEE